MQCKAEKVLINSSNHKKEKVLIESCCPEEVGKVLFESSYHEEVGTPASLL